AARDLVLVPPPTGEAPDDNKVDAESAFWDATTAMNTEAAYRAYLDRYPNGVNAATAKSRLDEILAEPNRIARQTEESLSLTRDARRQIQRDLTLLEYNTRGIDGIFGPGTRGALSRWQGENGFEATGYLTRDQIVRLDAQADRRSAELEAEAEARRAQLEQA
ncbi:peptidoglycan-binding protein, partial [Escherichia coli]|nr:peptidoglycan-binding protein [Escherichia coli]